MRIVTATAVVLLLALPNVASANGRFPNATQLVPSPTDRGRFALRATYGLMQTFDAGAHWQWLCERAVGYSGAFDPAIALAADGTLLAGLPDGLSVTSDRGCSWKRALGPSLVIDLTRSRDTPERLFAISVAGTDTLVHVSSDSAKSWSTSATLSGIRAETIDAAPSNGNRVYVSGRNDKGPVLLRSDDGGTTFTANDLSPGMQGVPFIAAVDPRQADVLYVRAQNNVTEAGTVADALYISRDAGRTFTRATVPVSQMLGVALSPDGSQLAVGGPDEGLYVARTEDLAFERKSKTRVRCLTWTEDALYACTSRDADGFAVGKSADNGATFTPFFDVPQLTHLECPAPSTVNESCAEEWQAVSSMIGEDPNDFVPDGGTKPPATTPAPSDDGGCGACRLGRDTSRGALALFALLGAALVSRRYQGAAGASRRLK